MKVIDISHHNGKINWRKVKSDGIGGVMIRASYGWYNYDKCFRVNVREVQEQGLPWGLYHYTYATNVSEARKELYGFLNALRGLKPTLPVVIDTEDADGYRRKHGNPSWELLAQMLVVQLQGLERNGYYAMWYASKSWAENLMRIRPELKKYDLWLAHWGVAKPSMPCGLWQYTSSGGKYGDGINTSDLNIAYVDYPTVIKTNGLNGWPKQAVKPTGQAKESNMLKDKNVMVCYKNDGDYANAIALLNGLVGLCKTATLIKGDNPFNGFFTIQVGGAAIKGADKVLSGKDRRDVLINIGKYLEEVCK